MSDSIYVVKAGDTLGRIARLHGTTPHALAHLNDITNIDVIRVGQKLRLSATPMHTDTPTQHDEDTESDAGSLWVQLVDALSQPIVGLKALVHAGDGTHEHVTGSDGFLPPVPIQQAGIPVRIEVAKAAGGHKEIAHWLSTTGHTHLLLTSPKIALASSLRPHDGPPKPSAKPAPHPVGKITHTRSPAGHPVQQVAMECPNCDNLKLGPNFKYRDSILAAAKRSGFKPQSIAAIMNAEAATIRSVQLLPMLDAKGKPVISKKTGKPRMIKLVKNTGEWDPRSASPLSSARGMTQFLDGSWIDQALTDGTYLNDYAKKQGWLTTNELTWVTTSKDHKGHLHHHHHERTVQAFVLVNGIASATRHRSLARVLCSRPYLTGRATASDAHLQSLLDLRFMPEYAIQTAVDYGMQNLKALSKAGYAVDSLDDGDKAKIVYLCHHLGIRDAKRFIDNTITEDRAKKLLITQIGSQRAKKYADNASGSYVKGHRSWLGDFIDSHVMLIRFECTKSGTDTQRKLIDITTNLSD